MACIICLFQHIGSAPDPLAYFVGHRIRAHLISVRANVAIPRLNICVLDLAFGGPPYRLQTFKLDHHL